MTISGEAFLRFILAMPDPVLVVSDDDNESIVASNAAACTLFGRDQTTFPELALRSILPNVVARSIAVNVDKSLATDHFVRAWAYIGEQLEAVTVGAVRIPSGGTAGIALFIRSESKRLKDPAAAEVSEARLQFALDSAGIGDWDMDLRTNIAFRSRLHDACFGYTIPPAEWGYDTFLAHVHPVDRERVNANYSAALAGKAGYDVEFRAVWPDGSIHWLWSKGRFYDNAAGTPIRVAGIQVDISERKRIEEGMRLNALAMASTTDSVIIADARAADHPVVYVNASFERITGFASAEILGRNCRLLQGADTSQPEIREISEALTAGRPAQVTLRNYRKDGTLFWNQLTLSPVYDDFGELTHYVGVQSDVTAKKQAEGELVHRATHDQLTGLPNQRLFEDRLYAAIGAADREGTVVAVAFIDIDRLKRVNDSLGHAGGDVLIAGVAARLSQSVRAIDTVARYGGDEFIIIFPDLTDQAAAEAMIRRLHVALSAPLIVDDVELAPTASFGIALYPHDATSIVDLVRFADTAMYAAKQAERGSYRFFDRASMHLGTDRLALENALGRAIAGDELALLYQPIYNARTGRVGALEALLRWHHPLRGVVMPNDFVPLAEESGLIVLIGEWVLREVCRQHRVWHDAGVPCVPIAVNVSIAQLRRRMFADSFQAILAQAGVNARCIVLEITESIVIENTELVLQMLGALRATGASISIDDFGTGFSSLSYLKRLSLDTLKIDKSFVDDIATDVNAAAICQAIVTLAHCVGLTTIAEGVETMEQEAFLRAIGCDELQGFYFTRPVNAETIERLLRGESMPVG